MAYIMVDVESDGPIPGDYSMICFGAVLVRELLGTQLMSASLIGRLGSSTFRLSAAAVSISLTGSCFSSESAPGPLYGAF